MGESTAPDPVELHPSLTRSLRAVLRFLSMSEPLTVDFWRSHELTLMQVRCLRLLRDEACFAGDLARRLGMSPASLTRLLERLEGRGLVTRSTDPGDRRRVVVHITPTGARLTGTIEFWLHTPAFSALERLTVEDREHLADMLELFVAEMEAAVAQDGDTEDLGD
jgi:DNA-binding MarR family transcriptional regulator